MKKRLQKLLKLNNAGMTLTELIVSFALLALFMVAATRIISYTILLYHQDKGATYGLEVTEMISEKVVSMLENAKQTSEKDCPKIINDGSAISFRDSGGGMVTIGVDSTDRLMRIHYDEIISEVSEDSFEATDWRFDKRAYMGYIVSYLNFQKASDAYGTGYDSNVLVMTIRLYSDRYGEYESHYMISMNNVEEIL